MERFYANWSPRALGALRIVTGLLFVEHGSAKLLGFPKIDDFSDLQIFSLLGLSGVLELVGGFLLLIGLFTRPVAFVLSGMMAVAYFLAHAPASFFPILNQGELAVLYSWVFFYVAVAGSGAWSIDERRSTAQERFATR